MKKIICVLLCAVIMLTASSCALLSEDKIKSLLSELGDLEVLSDLGDLDILSGLAGGDETEEPENQSGEYVFGNISIVLPDGFSITEISGTKTAVYSDYPTHTDNITFAEATNSISDYSEEALKQEFTSSFGEYKNFKYDKKQYDGYDLVTVSLDITYSGINMHVSGYTYFIDGKSVAVTFTSVSGEFDAAFETAASGIRVIK